MAAVRLYPPILEGTIPAFCGNTLTVPYTMNRAVGPMEVQGFVLKVRTVSGDLKEVIEKEEKINTDIHYTTFQLNGADYTVGEFYKVQIAYKSVSGVVGYFSTVAVVKYTTMPRVYIDGLSEKYSNANTFNYVGVFDQGESGDLTEKLFSSEFIIYDDENNIIAQSGNILHNTSVDDTPQTQYENFRFTSDLSASKNYYIVYKTVSVNNLEVNSVRYRLIQQRAISPEIDVTLNAELNYEQGYIRLYFDPDKLKTKIISGKFLITRKDTNKTDEWEELKFFAAESLEADKWEFKDFTIEHGVDYQYALQQYNSHGIYSSKIMANGGNSLKADFEDMFLFDGKRQLNIRFNPEVATFKNTILENKVETIGSKFPFISRNGNVNYKQFPINGLISYYMDEEELFLTKEEIDCEVATTNYTSENIFSERMFKLKVLDWLTDGKPKLFKSPNEGNYIVRLMNVSLTPERVTGRMIHKFQSQAYQIAETTALALSDLGIVIKDADDPEMLYQWQTGVIEDILLKHPIEGTVDDWYANSIIKIQKANDILAQQGDMTLEEFEAAKRKIGVITAEVNGERITINPFELSETEARSQLNQAYATLQTSTSKERWYQLNKDSVYSVSIRDMNPGDQIRIDGRIIQIGITGAYDFESDEPIREVSVRLTPQVGHGNITYSSEAKTKGLFDLSKNVAIEEVVAKQIYGDGITNYLLRYSEKNFQNIKDFQNRLSNPEEEVVAIQQVRFFKKDIQPLIIHNYKAGDKFIVNENGVAAIVNNSQVKEEAKFDLFGSSYAVSVTDPGFISSSPRTISIAEVGKLPSYAIYPVYNTKNEFSGTVVYFDKYYSREIKTIELASLAEFHDTLFSAYINDVRIEVDETEIYSVDNISGVYMLMINPGVIGEVSYIRAITTYDLEDEDLEAMRQSKDERFAELLEISGQGTSEYSMNETIRLYEEYYSAKNHYLNYLRQSLINYKQERGIELT